MEKDFNKTQLETMFNTAIMRNKRHGGDLESLYGFLLLMPLMKQHFSPDCDSWTLAPTVYQSYLEIVSKLPKNDPNKCIVAMGKVFGSVAKEHVGRSLYQLRAGNSEVHNQPLHSYHIQPSWIGDIDGKYVKSKLIDDNTIRLIGKNIEKFNSVTLPMDITFTKDNGGIMIKSTSITDDAFVKLTCGKTSCVYIPCDGSASYIQVNEGCLIVKLQDDQIWDITVGKSVPTLSFKNAIVEITQLNNLHAPMQKVYRDDICCICLDDMKNHQKKVLGCGHMFHCNCIQNWRTFKRSSFYCPMCKQ